MSIMKFPGPFQAAAEFGLKITLSDGEPAEIPYTTRDGPAPLRGVRNPGGPHWEPRRRTGLVAKWTPGRAPGTEIRPPGPTLQRSNGGGQRTIQRPSRL